MDKRLKAKWIKALRSGRYKQADQELKNADGYCCLGVLCTVAGARWVGDQFGLPEPMLDGKSLRKTDEDRLSLRFRREVGLTKRREDILIGLNDGHYDKRGVWHEPMSFREIAAHIEKHL